MLSINLFIHNAINVTITKMIIIYIYIYINSMPAEIPQRNEINALKNYIIYAFISKC